jgi:MscS family membrane protein
VRTFYNSLVTVPNSVVANSQVDNMGQRQYRRFKTTIGLTYDTPPDVVQAFVEGIRAVLTAHPMVRKDYYEVHLRDFGASSLDIMVYCFFVVPDWHEELVGRSQVLLEIMRLAQDLGVSFAFPSQSLYLESTPDRPVQARSNPEGRELAQRIVAFGPGGTHSRPRGPELTHGFHAGAIPDEGPAKA